MTASELQRIVLRLSNGAFVRYWLHWNYPCVEPWLMAIEIRDWKLSRMPPEPALTPVQSEGMEKLGFEWDEQDRRYYIERDVEEEGVKRERY